MKKNVKFSSTVVAYKVGNTEEHRSARNGVQDLRDRHRFQRRIDNLQLIFNNVLNKKINKILFHVLPFDD